MDADGADAVLLGGTDLFLAFEGREVDFPIVDAAKVHVADILASDSSNSRFVRTADRRRSNGCALIGRTMTTAEIIRTIERRTL